MTFPMWSISIYAFHVMCASLVASERIMECPNVCNCKWSGGKRTAECMGASLSNIPQGIDADTQVLNVTGNIMQAIGSKEFYRSGLVNLQRIYASRCGLLHLADDCFHMLTNLIELDLSHNFLTDVPSQALSDCNGLRRLSLSYNPIQRLQDGCFKGLHKLGTLELNHCQLHTIEPRAFEGMKQLEFLRIAHNNLETLSPAAIVQLEQPLYGLNLEENPWNCDCRLRDVRIWMVQHNIPLSLSPKCASPERLSGVSWSALDVDDFACKPEIIITSGNVESTDGDNATLKCEVDSVPTADIHWVWKGRLIQNLSLMSFGRQMYFIRNEESFDSKVSFLTIINVLFKDSGRYICVGANRAGNVSANVTLAVFSRIHDYSVFTSAEILAICIGLLVLVLVLLGAVFVIIAQHRKYVSQRTATCSAKSFGDQKYSTISAFSDNKASASAKPVYHTVVKSNTETVDLVSTFKLVENNADIDRRDASDNNLSTASPVEVHESSASSENSESKESRIASPMQPAELSFNIPTTSTVNVSLNDTSTTYTSNIVNQINGYTGKVSVLRQTQDSLEDDDDLVPAPAPKSSAREIMNVVHKELQLRQQQLRTAAVLATKSVDNQARNRRVQIASDNSDDRATRILSHEGQMLAALKRNNQLNKVIPNPMFNIALSPGSRDSPDEGLGDEREYDVEVMD